MTVGEIAPVHGGNDRRPARRRRLALAGTSAGLALALLALAGCAAQGGGTAGDGAVAAVEPAGPAAGYADSAADGPTARAGAPNVVPAGLQAPAVVVTGDMTLRSADVLRATGELTRLVAVSGGRVDSQATTTGGAAPDQPGPGASSTTTVRLPPARVDAFVRDAGALGSVASVNIARADASAEVADVAVRLANARASVVRVRTLLDRATRLADVVLLESEMSKRQSDLEALEARQRVLSDTTSLATLTVSIVTADAAVVPAEPDTGFLAGLRSGWTAFSTATVASLTVLGTLTPFLLLALALVAVGLVLRRRRTTPAPAVEEV